MKLKPEGNCISKPAHIKLFLFYLLASCLIFGSASLLASPASNKGATPPYTSKNFSRWLDAALIADATYKTKNDINKVLISQGYKLVQHNQLEGYSVGYILATNDNTKKHIIAVRGTSNVENAIVNVAFVLLPDALTGIDIHQGFLLSARDIYQKILPDLKSGYSIDTIGHSLGGAAALIVAMMLDAKGYDIGEVITFGQPKVTNISGSRKYSHLNITRLVTAKDVVPLLPPLDPMDMLNLSIFWHQGTEVVLFKNNQYAVLTGTSSMLRASDFLNDVPGEHHLNNHFMSTYIRYIKNKLTTAQQVKFKSDFKFSDWFGSSPTSGNQ